jgi:UDP-glucose:(heptosyl)LPS alpha-1,3-glucosyltransferase
VIERFVPNAGGVENAAWQVARELRRQGERVTVVARAFDEAAYASLPADQRPERIVLRVPTAWQPTRVLAFSRAAARATSDARFDLVHGFARTRHQDLYRAGGGSHAEYLHHMYGPAGRALRALSPRHRVLQAIEGAVFRDPHQWIQCASRLVSRALIDRHGVDPTRIHLLPNGVDVARHRSAAADGESLRRQWLDRDPSAERLWLLPGSGFRRKGLPVVLDAIERLADPGLRLLVAGRDDPGPWQRRVARRGLTGRIHFLGPRGDLPALYHAVDGVVLPTRYDAFANVTLEAAATGTPIVTTATNGAAEWLGEGVLIVDDPDDAEAFATALASLHDDAVRRHRGEAAARAAGALDWSSHVKSLRRLYAARAGRSEAGTTAR